MYNKYREECRRSFNIKIDYNRCELEWRRKVEERGHFLNQNGILRDGTKIDLAPYSYLNIYYLNVYYL